ncbi:hypothetical protein QE152_g6708 [Popillia japonica]|uniref:Uncharacterized protein n=1 Tax=Popillia japonica TaxID=7064 RepID=A0AAW1MI24_POPJA
MDIKIRTSYYQWESHFFAESVPNTNAPGVIAKKAYIKLEPVVAKNSGFSVLYEISQVLNGSGTNDCTIAVEKLPQYEYPPVTTCDVDRSDRRQKI